MTDQALVALNRALARAYRLWGRERLEQYLRLSLAALDVMDEQARGASWGQFKGRAKAQQYAAASVGRHRRTQKGNLIKQVGSHERRDRAIR
jgi:hypothetical protein